MATYRDLANSYQSISNLLNALVHSGTDLPYNKLHDFEEVIRKALETTEELRKECPGLMTNSELENAIVSFDMQDYNNAPCGIQDAAGEHRQKLKDEFEARGLDLTNVPW